MIQGKLFSSSNVDNDPFGVTPAGDMKRLKARSEFSRLFKAVSRKAARAGVTDGHDAAGNPVSRHERFERLHAANFQAFYGGAFEPKDLAAARGLPSGASWLDYAGTPELQANNERLRDLGRVMEELRGNRNFDEAVAAAKISASALRLKFRRYAGLYPENFEKCEPVREVEARQKVRAARAANQNAATFPGKKRA